MTAENNDSKDYYPGEQIQFTIRASAKKRMITTAIFTLIILVIIAGIFFFKNLYIPFIGAAALILVFWPLADAYERIEVTNMRIKRSEFIKKTSKFVDIPLDRLALCRETSDGSEIELLFFIDDLKTSHSLRCLRLNKADENAILLKQLPCPMQADLEQFLAANRK